MAARHTPERTLFGVNVKQTGGQKDGKRKWKKENAASNRFELHRWKLRRSHD